LGFKVQVFENSAIIVCVKLNYKKCEYVKTVT